MSDLIDIPWLWISLTGLVFGVGVAWLVVPPIVRVVVPVVLDAVR